MAALTPVRAASLFLARLAALSPRAWVGLAEAHVATAPPATPADLRAALRALELPGRRAAYLVLHEWLDTLATPLLAGVGRDGADDGDRAHGDEGASARTDARLGDALHLAEHAALALLVSDALDPAAVARLYAPFAEVIPRASLGAASVDHHQAAAYADTPAPPA